MSIEPTNNYVPSVVLPKNPRRLHTELFLPHRHIEKQYRDLPWPSKMKNIVVLTQIVGGRGDLVAAAKVLDLIQKLCPTVIVDWLLNGGVPLDPKSLLKSKDLSQIKIREAFYSRPFEEKSADLLLAGPVRFNWTLDYLESRIISRKICGPTFGFVEIGESQGGMPNSYCEAMEVIKEKSGSKAIDDGTLYHMLHRSVFPHRSDSGDGLLPMGILPGTGVFLSQSRINAPLSRGYCCPSYLSKIQNAELRTDILKAMNVFDEKSEPDYDQYSFNSGYAHRPISWGKFIDCVAIHEKNKHVIIVLNQQGVFDSLSTQEFQNTIFTIERLTFLKQKGYVSILLKGQEQEITILQEATNSEIQRKLVVIIRPCFDPKDMECLQLASERLLTTGDNSAVEAWCSKCILYFYEDVANAGTKWKFLQQQVDLAKTFSPNLARLLAIFGGDHRCFDRNSVNKPLDVKQMTELENLLDDPKLSDATLQLCNHIIANYSFEEILEGALKRTVWHHVIPDLARVEAEALGENFKTSLVKYLTEDIIPEAPIPVTGIPELGRRVQETVQAHLQQN